jgi:phosphoglycolate phosphatase
MRAMYKLALFDLDGTISDSSPGIFRTLKETFPLVDWPVPGPQALRRFIGPPLWNCLHETLETADRFVVLFRKAYSQKGIFENELYPGIRELFAELRSAGIKLAVVTSKPIIPARAVLDYFGVTELFDYISGADDSDRGGGKEELIFPVLKESGISAEDTVMIGDTKYDASGARKAGTNFIGVLYGFGTKEEMIRENGKLFSETVEGLGELLIDKT